jgi:4-carboxymuconolactone decarboxylase
VIEAIRIGAEPALADPRDRLLWTLARQLLDTNRIEAALFETARQALGVPPLVDVVGIVGYYSFVAMTLNAFEMYMPSPDAHLA